MAQPQAAHCKSPWRADQRGRGRQRLMTPTQPRRVTPRGRVMQRALPCSSATLAATARSDAKSSWYKQSLPVPSPLGTHSFTPSSHISFSFTRFRMRGEHIKVEKGNRERAGCPRQPHSLCRGCRERPEQSRRPSILVQCLTPETPAEQARGLEAPEITLNLRRTPSEATPSWDGAIHLHLTSLLTEPSSRFPVIP